MVGRWGLLASIVGLSHCLDRCCGPFKPHIIVRLPGRSHFHTSRDNTNFHGTDIVKLLQSQLNGYLYWSFGFCLARFASFHPSSVRRARLMKLQQCSMVWHAIEHGLIHSCEPCTEWLLKWWAVCHTLSLPCRRAMMKLWLSMTLWSFPMKIEAFLINRLCAQAANTHINNRFQSPFKCGDNTDNRARAYAMVIIVEMLILDISINRCRIECGETWGNAMRLIGEWGEKCGINRHLVLEQPISLS